MGKKDELEAKLVAATSELERYKRAHQELNEQIDRQLEDWTQEEAEWEAKLAAATARAEDCEWRHKSCDDCGKMMNFIGQGVYECWCCTCKDVEAKWKEACDFQSTRAEAAEAERDNLKAQITEMPRLIYEQNARLSAERDQYKRDLSRVTAEREAAEAEAGRMKEACKQLALATETQSARLMASAKTELEKEYYRGRGLGAAHIAARIERQAATPAPDEGWGE